MGNAAYNVSLLLLALSIGSLLVFLYWNYVGRLRSVVEQGQTSVSDVARSAFKASRPYALFAFVIAVVVVFIPAGLLMAFGTSLLYMLGFLSFLAAYIGLVSYLVALDFELGKGVGQVAPRLRTAAVGFFLLFWSFVGMFSGLVVLSAFGD